MASLQVTNKEKQDTSLLWPCLEWLRDVTLSTLQLFLWYTLYMDLLHAKTEYSYTVIQGSIAWFVCSLLINGIAFIFCL